MTEQIQGVLLDIDGTLVASNDAHARAWVEAFKANGYEVSFEKVRPLIGMGGDKVLPETVGLAKDSDIGKKISQQRKKAFLSTYISQVHAFPGAWELLQRLKQDGYTLVAASSAEPDELELLLKIINPQAPDIFSKKTSAKDAPHSKPDPDVIQAALQQQGLKAEESIMIGDTAYDIEAATKSRVKSIAFRSGGWSDKDLQGACAIYDGPADLLKQYERSPLAREKSRAE